MAALCIAIVSTIVAIIVGAAIGVGIWLGLRPGHEEWGTNQLEEFGKNATKMFELSANPCMNPNKFFCGGWEKNFNLPDAQPYWSPSFTPIARSTTEMMAKSLAKKCPARAKSAATSGSDAYDDMLSCYFAACMDTEKLEIFKAYPLYSKLNSELSPLYQVLKGSDAASADLSEFIANTWDTFGISAFLSFSVEPSVLPDSDGSNVVYLELSQSALGLDYDQYSNSDVVNTYGTDLGNSMADLAWEVQAYEGRLAGSAAKQRANSFNMHWRARRFHITSVELKLWEITRRPERRRDPFGLELKKKEDIKELLKSVLDFDKAFQPALDVLKDRVAEKDIRFVVDTTFIRGLANVISGLNADSIQLYLLSLILRERGDELSRNYRYAIGSFKGPLKKLQRKEECYSKVERDLGWIMSRNLLRVTEAASRRKEIAEQMLDAIRNTFSEVIKTSSWMEKDTKDKAIAKLNSLSLRVGGPAELLSNPTAFLESHYGKANVAEMRDLFSAAAFLAHAKLEANLHQYGLKNGLAKWHGFSHQVDAAYNPKRHEMFIPLAFLQSPWLHVWTDCIWGTTSCSPPEKKAFMQLLTYGALGSFMGRELIRVVGEGKSQLVKEAKCMQDQYSKYEVAFPDKDGKKQSVAVSGTATIDGNIIDNGGLQLALATLRGTAPDIVTAAIVGEPLSDYVKNSIGLFIMSYAQTLCSAASNDFVKHELEQLSRVPSAVRIIGTLSNLKEFPGPFTCAAVPATRFLQASKFDSENGVKARLAPPRCELW